MSLPVIQWDGQKISKPGLYAGITMEAYHGDLCVGPSISSSGLRTIFWDSPRAYFRSSYLNPRRKAETSSQPFTFGRAAHHLLLGEADFRKHFIVRPEKYPELTVPPVADWPETARLWDRMSTKPWSGNANICKAWMFWQWWSGKTVLTMRDIEIIRAMAEALGEEPMVQQGILSGLIEHSFIWQDKATGVWLKWRPDAIPTDSLDFSDLKTTVEPDDESLERTIGNYAYNMQGALGMMACLAVLERPMSSFTLVFVEKEDTLPCVRTKTVKPAAIDKGVEQLDVAVRTFAQCTQTGYWPGPGGVQTDSEYIDIPPWEYPKIDARMAELERQLAL